MDTDTLCLIAEAGSYEVAFTMALVCIDWRAAIQNGVGAVFDVRRSLLTLGGTVLMGDLVSVLALSPTNVKLAPHVRKRHRFGFYNIFTHDTAVRLFHTHGGFARFEARVARRAARKQRAL